MLNPFCESKTDFFIINTEKEFKIAFDKISQNENIDATIFCSLNFDKIEKQLKESKKNH